MIEDLYVLTEYLISWLFLFTGISVLIRPDVWIHFAKKIYSLDEKDVHWLAVITSICFLPMGLLTVLTHNDWDFSTPSVIITIIGWTIIVKTLLFFFFPITMLKTQEFIFKKKSDTFLKRFFRSFGILYIALSLWVLYQNI